LKNVKLNKAHENRKLNTQNQSARVPDGFTRNFSESSSHSNPGGKIDKQIDDKLNALESSLNSLLVLKKSFDSMNESLMELTKSIKLNNSKMCYFIADLFMSVVPSFKFDSEKVKLIQDAFIYHQLGQIDTNNLSNYCNKRSVNSNQRSYQPDFSIEKYFPPE
jgi:hypothetical protein